MASKKSGQSSSVWEHFEKVDGGNSVQCRLCKAELKYIGSTTSSVRVRLTRKHVSSPTAVAETEAKAFLSKSAASVQKFLGCQQISSN